MKYVLVSVGTRGDLQPFLALGRRLAARGDDVTVTAFASHRALVTDAGLRHAPLPGTPEGTLWPRGRAALRLALSQPLALYVAQRMALRRAAPGLARALAAAVTPDAVVVAGTVGAGVAALLQRDGHPAALALFAPLLPAGDHRATLMAAGRLGDGPANRALSGLLWGMSSGFTSALAGEFARVTGRRPPGPARVALASLPVLMATSPAVCPPAAEWPGRVIQTGFWAAAPDARVRDGAGTRPLLVTFGSSPGTDVAREGELVVAAADRAGVDVLWQHPGASTGPRSDRVRVIGAADHADVVGRVRAVVHHGGAGTTATMLTAGLPTFVTPLLGDQPYYGARVRALGAGPRPVPLGRLGVRSLARGLQRLAAGGHDAAAAALGRQLRAEDGVGRAVDALDRLVSRH